MVSQEAQDGVGSAGTSFTTADSVTVVGTVENVCPDEITFITSSTCLFAPWLVTGPGGPYDLGCGDAETEWTIGAGATLNADLPLGMLPIGSFVAQINFEGGATDSSAFDVHAP